MAVYGPWVEKVFDDHLAGATIKAMLVTDAFIQDVDHDYRADVIASEVAGTGYTAGGVAVTDFLVSYDPIRDAVVITCDPVSFGNPEIDSIGGLIFYVDTGSAATDRLIVADLFGPVDALGTSGLIYNPHADGLVVAQIGVSA